MRLTTVMKPSPPSWIIARITTCPNSVHCVQVSTRISPVTQLEEVAVNNPVKKPALCVPGGDGQGEQQGAHQNDDGEGGRHNPGGVEAPAPDKPVPQPEGASFQHGEILLCEGKNKLTQKSMPKKGISFGMLLRI